MTRKIVFPSDPAQLAKMREAVRDFLAQCALDENDTALLVLALDEACTNIIRHAYRNEPRPIRIEMTRLANRIRFVLRDYGTSCDPAKIRSRDLADIRPGGVGVHIIKQAFDTVTYEPQPRGTRLTLEKALPASRPTELR